MQETNPDPGPPNAPAIPVSQEHKSAPTSSAEGSRPDQWPTKLKAWSDGFRQWVSEPTIAAAIIQVVGGAYGALLVGLTLAYATGTVGFQAVVATVSLVLFLLLVYFVFIVFGRPKAVIATAGMVALGFAGFLVTQPWSGGPASPRVTAQVESRTASSPTSQPSKPISITPVSQAPQPSAAIASVTLVDGAVHRTRLETLEVDYGMFEINKPYLKFSDGIIIAFNEMSSFEIIEIIKEDNLMKSLVMEVINSNGGRFTNKFDHPLVSLVGKTDLAGIRVEMHKVKSVTIR